MRLLRWLYAACLLASGTAHAAPVQLDGEWTLTFSSGGSEKRQAVLRISGASGSWMTIPRQGKEAKDPCVGREFPLKVADAEAARVVIEASLHSLVAGCKDRRFEGKVVDGGSVEGKLENGHPATMNRR